MSLQKTAEAWGVSRSCGRLARPGRLALGLDAVYLGYWIKNLKMSYKTQYRPIELLINQRWVALN